MVSVSSVRRYVRPHLFMLSPLTMKLQRLQRSSTVNATMGLCRVKKLRVVLWHLLLHGLSGLYDVCAYLEDILASGATEAVDTSNGTATIYNGKIAPQQAQVSVLSTW